MSEHPDLAHYTLSQSEILRMREDWLQEGRQQAAQAVLHYADERMQLIAGSKGMPVIPQKSEDIVAALRVAARRAGCAS